MSSTAWVVLLATLGFVAEVLGVGLIVFDIRDSRRQARRIVGRAVTLHVDSVVQEQRVSPIQLGGGGGSHLWTNVSTPLSVGVGSWTGGCWTG